MLLALEMIITFLLGVVLGRIWEIRKQILLAAPIDQRSRPVDLHATARLPGRPARSDIERLAALDREMQDLIKSAAIRGQRSNDPSAETQLGARPAALPIVLEGIWPRTTKAAADRTLQSSWNE